MTLVHLFDAGALVAAPRKLSFLHQNDLATIAVKYIFRGYGRTGGRLEGKRAEK
jgi:hypothetical protein